MPRTDEDNTQLQENSKEHFNILTLLCFIIITFCSITSFSAGGAFKNKQN